MVDELGRRAGGPGPREGTPRSSGRGEQVAVLGLGRFGGAVAAELVRLGFDVLGVDGDEDRVRYYANLVTHVAEADITDEEALRQLGVAEMNHGVVAVGSDIEASILATAALDDLRVPNIWAKATSKHHARILERVGAHHVVLPEHDMGHRVAHMLGGRMVEWFQLDDKFALVETVVPAELVGSTLAEAGVRARYGVTVVCAKPKGGSFTYATPDTAFAQGDVLVVAGETAAVEAFARLR
jgi:trk system potassium uptake protein TrkA